MLFRKFDSKLPGSFERLSEVIDFEIVFVCPKILLFSNPLMQQNNGFKMSNIPGVIFKNNPH
jgi:hypothetical protein